MEVVGDSLHLFLRVKFEISARGEDSMSFHSDYQAVIRSSLLLLTIILLLAAVPACSATQLLMDEITLPAGFSIDVYARNVPGARSMALGEKGTLFVGTRSEGKVYAIVAGKGEQQVITIAK